VGLAPPRPCPTPNCPALVRGRGPCARCRQRRERLRPSAAARGYDAEWAEYSRRWLSRFPWCGQRQDGTFHEEHSRCVAEGRRQRAEVTDHILALIDGGARLDPINHQSLCRRCNARKVIR